MKKTGFQITFDDGVTKTEYLQAIIEQKNLFENIGWVDDFEDKSIASAEFSDNIRVFVEVKGINIGEKVKLELYAKSNGVFIDSTIVEYESEVEKKFQRDYVIFSIKLDPLWKINNPVNNINIIDSIYGKVSYKGSDKDFSSKGLDLVSQKLKGIFLQKGNDEAYYYEGELYTKTNDEKGMMLYAENPRRLFREIKEALDLIYSKPNGKKFLNDIFKLSNPNFITITRENSENFTLSRKVSWSPADKNGGLDENGKTKRPAFLSLAHELWHAWENWSDPNMNNPIWIPANGTTVLKNIVYKEFTASQFENTIRVEHNWARRKWYSYSEDEKGNKQGHGKIF